MQTPYVQSLYDLIHIKGGNVGVATNAPQSTLDVSGSAFVRGVIDLASNATPVGNPTLCNVRIYNDGGNNVKVKDATGRVHVLTPLRNKGDLVVHNGTTETALNVGADSTVLIADSATPSGLRWAPLDLSAVSGGGQSLSNNVYDTLYAATIYTSSVVYTPNVYESAITTEPSGTNTIDFNDKALLNVSAITGTDGLISMSNSSLSNVNSVHASLVTADTMAAVTLSNVDTIIAKNGVISVLNSSLSNIDGINAEKLQASNVEAAFVSTSTLDVATISSSTGRISFSNATLSNVQTLQASEIEASNIVYRSEPTWMTIPPTFVSNTTFTKVFSWLYQGDTPNIREPKRMLMQSYLTTTCNVSSYISDPAFVYSSRLVNVTNNTVLGQITASNATPIVNTIDIPSVPRSNIAIELQVKKGQLGSYVVLDSLGLEF